MRREDLYLRDIVAAADSIGSFLDGVERERFLGDEILQSAVLHKLTIIGEAASRISDGLRSARPEIPWPDVIGFRNIAVHA